MHKTGTYIFPWYSYCQSLGTGFQIKGKEGTSLGVVFLKIVFYYHV